MIQGLLRDAGAKIMTLLLIATILPLAPDVTCDELYEVFERACMQQRLREMLRWCWTGPGPTYWTATQSACGEHLSCDEALHRKGSRPGLMPSDCQPFDMDNDRDVDLRDWAVLQRGHG